MTGAVGSCAGGLLPAAASVPEIVMSPGERVDVEVVDGMSGQVIAKAPNAPLSDILPVVREVSPGPYTVRCVFAPSTAIDDAGRSRFVLEPTGEDKLLAQARLASEALGFDGIEFANLSVYDVASIGERFDLVIFMGVLYHLRHPLLALDLIRLHVLPSLHHNVARSEKVAPRPSGASWPAG